MRQTAFLSISVQIAVCTAALGAVWALLGLARGGGGNRTRVHCHLLQTLPPRPGPLSSSISPTLFPMVSKLHVKLYKRSCNADLQREFHGPGFPYPKCHWENTFKQTFSECGVLPGDSPAAAKPLPLLGFFTASCTPEQPCQKHLPGENTQQDRS